jgi:Na+-driven multidrug efflux pump
MRVDGFVMMPNFSFGNAMTVYAGQNMGAGKLDRISQGTKQCTLLAFGTALIMVVVILLFGRQIAGLFTQTEEVLAMSALFLQILAVGYLAFSVSMVLWGAIRGAGDAITPMWGSLINIIVVRVPLAYLLVHLIGEPVALIYALLAAWIANMLQAVISYRIGKWRTKELVKPLDT